jgi:hypothetical protein
MHQLDQKKLLIERILPYLTGAPADAVQRLLQKSVSDLEEILDDAITKRARAQAAERVKQHADEMRRESQLEGAWTHALRKVWLNGKQRLVDCESNKSMFESLTQPHEEPSASLYSTIALSYPTKFSWCLPQPRKTDADRLAEFQKICRENNLSECAANQQLHKVGVALDAWAGASVLERAAFQAQGAQERQHFLIHEASPLQLKEEAKYQSATEREIAIKAEADRQHQFVSQAQAGLYSPLPTHNQAGELMDGKYFKRISTLDYQLFKAMVRKHGSAQITERLRSATPAVPAV